MAALFFSFNVIFDISCFVWPSPIRINNLSSSPLSISPISIDRSVVFSLTTASKSLLPRYVALGYQCHTYLWPECPSLSTVPGRTTFGENHNKIENEILKEIKIKMTWEFDEGRHPYTRSHTACLIRADLDLPYHRAWKGYSHDHQQFYHWRKSWHLKTTNLSSQATS